MVDVFTDILVCYSIYLANEANKEYAKYFYASILFVVLPLTVSLSITFYHIYYKWNDQKMKKTTRISNYLHNYKYVLILTAIISCDFYSAINLARSKLFCLQMFNLQLKSNEQRSLIIWKFLNQTLICRILN